MSQLRIMNGEIKYIVEKTSRTWYVVFEPRRGEFHFWHLFTRKKFNHVWAYTPLETGTLIVAFNPHECLLEEWPLKAEEVAQFLSKDVTAVLKYKANYEAFKRYMPRGIINCVVLVKCLLGVGEFSLTPLGLYKQLKRMGATDDK